MRAYLLILLFIVFVTTELSAIQRGPFYTRNQVLSQYIFLGFYPLKAELFESKFELVTDYTLTSVIRIYLADKYYIWSDYELNHFTLNPFWRISKNLEMSINGGAMNYWGGFLDNFVQDYHKKFNFPNGQRGFVDNSRVQYQIGDYSKKWVNRDEATSGLRDTSAMLRYNVLNYKKKNSNFSNTAFTLGASVEAPTGCKNCGFSNGSWDYGVSLYFDQGLFQETLFVYYMGSYIRVGEMENDELTIPIKNYKTGHSLAFELNVIHTVSPVVQINWDSSPYETENKALDTSACTMVLGLNMFKTKTSMLQVAFTEDLNHNTTPDFSWNFAYHQGF